MYWLQWLDADQSPALGAKEAWPLAFCLFTGVAVLQERIESLFPERGILRVVLTIQCFHSIREPPSVIWAMSSSRSCSKHLIVGRIGVEVQLLSCSYLLLGPPPSGAFCGHANIVNKNKQKHCKGLYKNARQVT